MTPGYQVGAYQPFPAYQQETVAVEQPSGGWWRDWDWYREQRRRKRREQEAREQAAEAIQVETDREIAKLLHEQEAKRAEKEDLARLKKLVDEYRTEAQKLPPPVAAAWDRAFEQRTVEALSAFRRSVIRMQEEEEEMAIIAVLSMLD